MKASRALWCAAALTCLLPRPAIAAQPQPAPTPSTWIEAGDGVDRLSNGLADWQTTYFSFATRSSPRTGWYGNASINSRFGRTDPQYLLGAYFPPSPNTIVNLEFATSPTHAILPSSDAGLSLDHRLAAGWGYALGLRERSYTGANVSMGTFSVDRYWRGFRAAYTLSGTRLSNVPGTSLSHALLLTRYYGLAEASSLTVTLDVGREAENDGGPVLLSTVSGASLTGTHWFDMNNFAITWAASVTRQGRLYTRSGVQVGFRRRI